MADLKERLRANALDECDEAIERIEALEGQVRKLEKENQDMRDRLAKVYAISDVSRL